MKGENKQSVIAYFVFTEYLRNSNEVYATVGTVQSSSKNAKNVGATPKFIKAWNRFIGEYQGDNYFNGPRVVYNDFGAIGFDWYGTNESTEVSLHRFLSDSNELDETAFPDFTFKFYDLINSFGI